MACRHPSLFVVIVASVGVLASLATPQRAAAGEERWLLRMSGVSVTPDITLDTMDAEGQRITASGDGAKGFGVEVEYRLNDRLGLTVGGLSAAPRVVVRVTPPSGEPVSAGDDLSMRPLTVGLDVHLTPASRVDLSVGLMVAYVAYGDLELDAGEGRRLELSSDDDVGWGATVGADVRQGDGPWSIGVSASYLDTTLRVSNAEDPDTQEVDVDPFILGLGVGYRF